MEVQRIDPACAILQGEKKQFGLLQCVRTYYADVQALI